MKKAKKKKKTPAAKRGKVSKAHTLRKKARASLRKAGKPIPKDLKKGGLKKAMKKAKKKKKMPAAKRGKVSKAHTLRKKARASLRKAGKPIPKDLKKGGLKKAMK